MDKSEAVKLAMMLPLTTGFVLKRKDIVEQVNRLYLSDVDKKSIRSLQNYMIQANCDEGLLDRVKRGYYKITDDGFEWLRKVSLSINNDSKSNMLSDIAYLELEIIHKKIVKDE